MDTIYGNPKSVKLEIYFLEKSVPKVYTEYHGDIFRNISRYRIMNIKNLYRRNKVSYINYQMFFNEKKLKEKEIWYNYPDEIERGIYYSYDKNENLIEKKEVFFDDVFYLQKKYYSKSNRVIASSRYFSDTPNEFIHWYYFRNKDGKLIKIKSINDEGKISTNNYELNQKGEVVREFGIRQPNWRFPQNKSNSFNKEITKVEYIYNKNGNRILQLNYNTTSNRIYSKHVSKFDNQNNLIEKVIFVKQKDTTKQKLRRYKYNNDNYRVYEEDIDLDGFISTSIMTSYNNEDCIIKTIHFENDTTSIFDFKYKFDRKGNWTKITKIVNGEPLYIWTRKIKYY
ncbi:hypothetical protein [Lacinutrix jangbogonensis]|uniref:hypothetical protein n=1 Tax=Lacinutrix jangbogonensis TaxID=1469557 RepID=UPI00053D3100|nr:hypothetical protein [Lacinutrix jangbogonensis]